MAGPHVSSYGVDMALNILREAKEFEDIKKHHGRAALIFCVRNSERKHGERLIIILKIRNKFKTKPDQNGNDVPIDWYYIPADTQKRAWKLARASDATDVGWLAIQLDAGQNKYSCYFGYLSELKGNRIPMGSEDTDRK